MFSKWTLCFYNLFDYVHQKHLLFENQNETPENPEIWIRKIKPPRKHLAPYATATVFYHFSRGW